MGPSPESDGNSSYEIPRNCGGMDDLLRAELEQQQFVGVVSSDSFASVLLFATSAHTLRAFVLASGSPEICCTSPLARLRTRLAM